MRVPNGVNSASDPVHSHLISLNAFPHGIYTQGTLFAHTNSSSVLLVHQDGARVEMIGLNASEVAETAAVLLNWLIARNELVQIDALLDRICPEVQAERKAS